MSKSDYFVISPFTLLNPYFLMSGSYPTTVPLLSAYGILLIVIVSIVVLTAGGLTFFYMFPEIRNPNQTPQTPNTNNKVSNQIYHPISLLKTINKDQRKVITLLKNNYEKYLQNMCQHRAGLSRLNAHRILICFVERGIVTLQKTRNINEVTLADWLK